MIRDSVSVSTFFKILEVMVRIRLRLLASITISRIFSMKDHCFFH